MCGIVGAIGSLTAKEENVFRWMLFFDTIRGVDSTGAVSIDHKENKFTMEKLPVAAMDIMSFSPLRNGETISWDHKKFDKITAGVNSILIGHNRAATRGKVTKENSHPFHHHNIIGVHNGTIKNQHRLPDHQNFDVDSDNIFYAMSKEGPKETLEKLDGAYAVVYWDGKDRTVNFARNSERPLWFIPTKDKRTVFFASEKEMILLAARRSSLELADPVELQEGVIVSITLPDRMKEFSKENYKFTKFKVLETPFGQSYQYSGSYHRDSTFGGGVNKQEEPARIPHAKPPIGPDKNNLFFTPEKVSAKSHRISKTIMIATRQLEDILKCGCSSCATKKTLKEANTVRFFGEKEFLCNNCYESLIRDQAYHQYIY